MEYDFIIRRETPSDYDGCENLVREAFWNVYRPGCMEHFVLKRFRDDPDFVPELDLVMEKDNRLIGQVMFARAKIKSDDGREIPLMTFGPICILPELKRMGYGKRLMDYSLEKAAAMSAGAIAMTGNIAFYGKCGFTLASSKGIRYAAAEPDDGVVPYFLIQELEKGYLDGVTGTFREPEGYFVCERFPDEFEEYEASFPPKAKLKLPGQLV